MIETPPAEVPIDPKEQPVLDKFLAIRNSLVLLKKDRTAYVKSQDILPLFDQLVETIKELQSVRNDTPSEKKSRVDSVLDDCAQLMSLFFLTVGRNHEAPALYAPTLIVRRLLDHLIEANMYTAKDLIMADEHIKEMREIVETSQGRYAPRLLALLTQRLDGCQQQLDKLHAGVGGMSPELVPVHEKLVSIIRSTSAACTRTKFPTSEVEQFKEELVKIDSTRKDGKFRAEDGSVLEGDDVVSSLLHRSQMYADELLENHVRISDNLKPLYDQLRDIRDKLEKISLTQAWSLRETDLFLFTRQLDRIDDARVNGKFVDSQGQAGEGQHILRYLLRRSYVYIYMFLLASEPVSEALLPIYNQLKTLRRCLQEVQRSGGVSSARELYPYSMKLNSIRNMQENGKFRVNNEEPEGQENVNSLLEECLALCTDLKDSASGKESET